MKKRSIAGILAILTVLLLSTFFVPMILSSGAGGNRAAGGISAKKRFLTRKQFEKAASQLPPGAFSPEEVLWQDGPAACDAESATVFLPCDPEALEAQEKTWAGSGESLTGTSGTILRFWEGLLEDLQPASGDARICLETDLSMKTPAEAMRSGYAFPALLLTKEEAKPFSIVLTGLPVLCLWKTDPDPIVRKEDHEASIRLLSAGKEKKDRTEGQRGETQAAEASLAGAREDRTGRAAAPAASGEDQTGREAVPAASQDGLTERAVPENSLLHCTFHVRGNVTSSLAKKPYRLSLTDASGTKTRISWLGLRTDDDWILNPVYTDRTRVREKSAYELWDTASSCARVPQPSSRMEYVEVFQDDACLGIYLLMEPVDGRQLGLTPGDLLYKIDRWDYEYPYFEEYRTAEERQETEIYTDHGYPCVEIKYPRSWDRTASWDLMRRYHEYSFRNGEESLFGQASADPDLDSVVTLSLYCALTHAMDNNWKNSFLIAQKEETGRYTLRRTIWDLNYVFGDVFVYDPEIGYTVFDPDSAAVYVPGKDSTWDYEAFLQSDPALEKSLRQKWRQWREAGISADRVLALIGENRALLEKSGALVREGRLWPESLGGAEALEEMEEWILRRFSFLDSFFGYEGS